MKPHLIPHTDAGDFTRCRRPDKVAYPSRATARRQARDARGDGYTGLVAYRCPAGHWHIGHPNPYQQRKSA